jgi:hypothetical protein
MSIAAESIVRSNFGNAKLALDRPIAKRIQNVICVIGNGGIFGQFCKNSSLSFGLH